MIINRVSSKIYMLLIIFSVLVGILYILLSLYNEKLLKKKTILLFILIFIMSVVCAKLFSVVITGFKISFKDASLSSYGALLGVLVSSIIYEMIFPENGKIIKYSTIALPIMYSFGKIACLFRGCCYGIDYNGILSITYNHLSKPVFPIQLLEIVVFFLLFIYSNTNKNRKDITYITILFISIFKYLGEFLRYDFSPFNANQTFSIILFIITLFFYKMAKN